MSQECKKKIGITLIIVNTCVLQEYRKKIGITIMVNTGVLQEYRKKTGITLIILNTHVLQEYRKKISQLQAAEEEKQMLQLENNRLREEMQDR